MMRRHLALAIAAVCAACSTPTSSSEKEPTVPEPAAQPAQDPEPTPEPAPDAQSWSGTPLELISQDGQHWLGIGTGDTSVALYPEGRATFCDVVDLTAAVDLPTHCAGNPSQRVGSEARPVAVILLRSERKVDPPTGKGASSWRGDGVERALHMVLVDVTAASILWSETIERDAADGYGGHEIDELRIETVDGRTQLTGMRQDKLPAHRARCMRPKPVPVRYVLTDGRFVAGTVLGGSAPCR